MTEFKTCIQCKNSFERPSEYTERRWFLKKTCSPKCHSDRRKNSCTIIPKVYVLTDLYISKEMTCEKIGEEFSVSGVTVSNWLRKVGIKARKRGRGFESRGLEPPQKHDLQRMVHDEHKSYIDIAKFYGFDKSCVRHWLIKYDIEFPKAWDTRYKGKRPETPDSETLCELYSSGMSVADIGSEYEVSSYTILELCKTFGVELRNGGFFNKKNPDICKNGLRVRSSYEKRVADWLIGHSLPFDYEPKIPYQNSRRSDFLANGWFIEVWGLIGWGSYDKKRLEKTDHYLRHQLPLIDVIPGDFQKDSRLSRVLSRCLHPAPTTVDHPEISDAGHSNRRKQMKLFE